MINEYRYVKIIALMVGAGVQFSLLIINLLITAKMDLDDRGMYALIVAVVMTVSGVSNFGFINALIKRMHSEQLTKNYVTSLGYLVLFQIIVALGFVFALLLSFPSITYDFFQQLGLMVTFIVISLLLRAYGQALLLGMNRINLFQVSKVVPVVFFVLILLMQDRYLLTDVLFAWMASELLLVLFLMLNVFILLQINHRNKNNGFNKDFKFGLRSLLGHTAFIEGYKFDVIVLGYILPVADLAIYAVSKSVALVLRFVPQSLSQVAYPSTLKVDDKDKAGVIKRFVLAAILAGSLLVVVGYFLYVGLVIDFLGEAYAESANVVLIMFLGVLAYVPRRILYEYFKAMNNPGVTSKIEVMVVIGYLLLLMISEILGVSNLIILATIILVSNLIALIFTMMLAIREVNLAP